ncbi:MAG: hypothetical protein DI535_06705 [Citrobacter freundii]|nr:MAG: hypothetical protein DI535_06705 [Citrobacter freundii]
MDKFHEHLLSQQDRLDADLPNEKVWDRIDASLSEKKVTGSVNAMFRYLAAASVIALVAAGFWMENRKTVHNQEKNTAVTTHAPEKDSAAMIVTDNKPVIVSRTIETPVERESAKPVVQEQPIEKLSADYAALISSRLQKLRATPVYAECSDYFSDFTGQLKQMDKDGLNIQHDLQQYGLQDALIEQLIEIYERKLRLLKELQAQITRMNRKAGLRAGASKQTEPCFINL